MNSFMLGIAKKLILELVEELMTEENIREYGDMLFDFVEDAIESSKTTFVSMLVLPIIKQLRVTLDIPDRPDD